MYISIIFARTLLATARQHSTSDTDALLCQCGIEPSLLSDSRAMLTLEQSMALTSRVIDLTGDHGLGLTLGASVPSQMLQVVGLLVISRRTIREAFGSFQQYAMLLDDGPRWGLSEHGESARFTCAPDYQLGSYTRAGMEFALAMAFRIGREFVGASQALQGVYCQHPEPAHVQRYRELFRCPVYFDQPLYALEFPRVLLDRQQQHADELTYTALERTAEEMLTSRARKEKFSERVRVHMRHQGAFSELDVTALAARMKISLRTLRRRLSAEGTSFAALLTEARCEAACASLRSAASLRSTAALVGFTEQTAFHRAFKRWTGSTPAAYRRESHAPPRVRS